MLSLFPTRPEGRLEQELFSQTIMAITAELRTEGITKKKGGLKAFLGRKKICVWHLHRGTKKKADRWSHDNPLDNPHKANEAKAQDDAIDQEDMIWMMQLKPAPYAEKVLQWVTKRLHEGHELLSIRERMVAHGIPLTSGEAQIFVAPETYLRRTVMKGVELPTGKDQLLVDKGTCRKIQRILEKIPKEIRPKVNPHTKTEPIFLSEATMGSFGGWRKDVENMLTILISFGRKENIFAVHRFDWIGEARRTALRSWDQEYMYDHTYLTKENGARLSDSDFLGEYEDEKHMKILMQGLLGGAKSKSDNITEVKCERDKKDKEKKDKSKSSKDLPEEAHPKEKCKNSRKEERPKETREHKKAKKDLKVESSRQIECKSCGAGIDMDREKGQKTCNQCGNRMFCKACLVNVDEELFCRTCARAKLEERRRREDDARRAEEESTGLSVYTDNSEEEPGDSVEVSVTKCGRCTAFVEERRKEENSRCYGCGYPICHQCTEGRPKLCANCKEERRRRRSQNSKKEKSRKWVQLKSYNEARGGSNSRSRSTLRRPARVKLSATTKVQIYIRTLNEGTIPAVLSMNSNVYDIKSFIRERFGIPTRAQMLTLRSKLLRDNQKFYDIPIQRDDRIELTSYLRGGTRSKHYSIQLEAEEDDDEKEAHTEGAIGSGARRESQDYHTTDTLIDEEDEENQKHDMDRGVTDVSREWYTPTFGDATADQDPYFRDSTEEHEETQAQKALHTINVDIISALGDDTFVEDDTTRAMVSAFGHFYQKYRRDWLRPKQALVRITTEWMRIYTTGDWRQDEQEAQPSGLPCGTARLLPGHTTQRTRITSTSLTGEGHTLYADHFVAFLQQILVEAGWNAENTRLKELLTRDLETWPEGLAWWTDCDLDVAGGHFPTRREVLTQPEITLRVTKRGIGTYKDFRFYFRLNAHNFDALKRYIQRQRRGMRAGDVRNYEIEFPTYHYIVSEERERLQGMSLGDPSSDLGDIEPEGACCACGAPTPSRTKCEICEETPLCEHCAWKPPDRRGMTCIRCCPENTYLHQTLVGPDEVATPSKADKEEERKAKRQKCTKEILDFLDEVKAEIITKRVESQQTSEIIGKIQERVLTLRGPECEDPNSQARHRLFIYEEYSRTGDQVLARSDQTLYDLVESFFERRGVGGKVNYAAVLTAGTTIYQLHILAQKVPENSHLRIRLRGLRGGGDGRTTDNWRHEFTLESPTDSSDEESIISESASSSSSNRTELPLQSYNGSVKSRTGADPQPCEDPAYHVLETCASHADASLQETMGKQWSDLVNMNSERNKYRDDGRRRRRRPRRLRAGSPRTT